MREIIDRILELESKATGGPWFQILGTIQQSTNYRRPLIICQWPSGCLIGDKEVQHDHEFITAMRNNIKPILLRMKALEDVADAARANADLVVNYNIPRDWALEDALNKLDECEK